jgi:hypothetical protein
LRLLCRRGFLVCQTSGGAAPAVYRRSETWPPPAEFFREPVGFTYYLQKWFQYYLEQWIENRMSELEAKEGVYSLDFFRDNDGRRHAGNANETPAADGQFIDENGQHWAADVSLILKQADLSRMDLDWVRSTNDARRTNRWQR